MSHAVDKSKSGSIVARLTGRAVKPYLMDPDNIKMVYNGTVNRVYMETNGIKSKAPDLVSVMSSSI